jgi:hypothetical protein
MTFSIDSIFSGISDFVTDTIPSWFDSDSPVTSTLADVGKTALSNVPTTTPTPPTPPKGFWDKVGDAALSPTGLSAILSSGLGLYSGLGELDLAKKKEEADRLTEKNNMLLAMAKLKAGTGGGGGGGGNSRLAANQAIIDAVRSGYKNKSGALNQWVNNYMRAYGR